MGQAIHVLLGQNRLSLFGGYLLGRQCRRCCLAQLPVRHCRACFPGIGCVGHSGRIGLDDQLHRGAPEAPNVDRHVDGNFHVSTILDPIIGGAFTSEVCWRWCFWLNLPVGSVVLVLLVIFFRVPRHISPIPATGKEIILQLDIPGFSVLLLSLVCLTLALQWGGLSKPWSDGSVIATLVMWVVLTIGFFVTEWFQGCLRYGAFTSTQATNSMG